jgi:K+-sensing histidine kinase KdpD
MTHGTSAHGAGLSGRWADTGREEGDGAWRRWTAGVGLRIEGIRAAGEAAPLQLLAVSAVAGLAVGLAITEAWRVADVGPSGPAGLHLALLAVACAVAALTALWPGGQAEPAPRQEHLAGSNQLLAQLHHDLRTPLNAMIGFSEVMLRELHGPLGNARYQEYAAHISESGGRLLKASEDALAVATAMSALVTDRQAERRERRPAAALVQEAWVASAVAGSDVRLNLEGCWAVEIECDGQATSLALQHLLGEAMARARPGGVIAATGRYTSGARYIEIAVEPCRGARDGQREERHSQDGLVAAGGGLRVILARSLLEMQGATLSVCSMPHAEGWSAGIGFPLPAGRRPRLPRRRPTAGSPRLVFQGRREDFGGVSAARASAGSRAAPPV